MRCGAEESIGFSNMSTNRYLLAIVSVIIICSATVAVISVRLAKNTPSSEENVVLRVQHTIKAVLPGESAMETYELDAKAVSKEEFIAVQNMLLGQENWSCVETDTGGYVSYEQVDASGQRYLVTLESGGSGVQSIRKAPVQR